MNRKIPYHELAALLAGHCNITPTEAEDFIKSFFDQLKIGRASCRERVFVEV